MQSEKNRQKQQVSGKQMFLNQVIERLRMQIYYRVIIILYLNNTHRLPEKNYHSSLMGNCETLREQRTPRY